MASFEKQGKEEGLRQNSKENQKYRKKSGVPNWLKKHTKWGRKNPPVDNACNECSVDTPAVNSALVHDQNDKRKESIWKKGLSYVKSPKTPLSNEPTTEFTPAPVFPQLVNPQATNPFSCEQHPSLLQLALLSAPQMLMSLSFGQDPRSSCFPSSFEQAYLQQYHERLAYLEQLYTHQMVWANLQQAVALAEQSRAEAATLEQGYLRNKLTSSHMDFQTSQSLNGKHPLPVQEMDVDIHTNDVAPHSRMRYIQCKMPFEDIHMVDDCEALESSNNLSLNNETLPTCSTADNIFKENAETCSGSNLSQKNNSPVDLAITDHITSPERLQKTVPFTTNNSDMDGPTECKADNEDNQKQLSQNNSPLHSDTSSSSSQRKRLKRNAISAEPSSYNEAVVGSGLFNKVLCLIIPKSTE